MGRSMHSEMQKAPVAETRMAVKVNVERPPSRVRDKWNSCIELGRCTSGAGKGLLEQPQLRPGCPYWSDEGTVRAVREACAGNHNIAR